jgi:peptide chain release factor 2
LIWKTCCVGTKTSGGVPRNFGGIFDGARLEEQLAETEQRIAAPDFWSNQTTAQQIMQRRRHLDDELTLLKSLQRRQDDLGVLIEWANGGEDVTADLIRGLDELQQEIEAAETKKMLGGEHDRANAIVTIHPGAGGTESQDWAGMLMRMYVKWSERRGFKREIMDLQPGDDSGVKSVTLMLVGDYAYGLMTAEAGVHRLVRISPYDPAARRHTSFASVFVWPELPEDSDVEIDEKDLRIDTYRSSGAGGQHVNVTDSAVRHEGAEVAALRPEAEGTAGQARTDRRREDRYRLGAPDPQLRSAAVPDGQGPQDEDGGWRSEPRARGRPRPLHQALSDEEGERDARRTGGG